MVALRSIKQLQHFSKIGIFGGSFDPPHQGHLALAQIVQESLNLDCIVFVPTKKNPLKQNAPIASDSDRVAMLELLLASCSQFFISDIEIESRELTSYTVDTLRKLRAELGESKTLYLILGSDSYKDFSAWREPEAIQKMADLVVVDRTGVIATVSAHKTAMPVVVINKSPPSYSSTEIRDRLFKEEAVIGLSAEVASYIRERKLYKPTRK